jgi:hypothetical protein
MTNLTNDCGRILNPCGTCQACLEAMDAAEFAAWETQQQRLSEAWLGGER